MKLDSQALLSEFYEMIKDDYPEISFEMVKEACFGPWIALRHEMESGELPEVRFTYFGTFQVYPGRAKYMLYALDKKLEAGNITPLQHERYIAMITKYLKKLEDGKV